MGAFSWLDVAAVVLAATTGASSTVNCSLVDSAAFRATVLLRGFMESFVGLMRF